MPVPCDTLAAYKLLINASVTPEQANGIMCRAAAVDHVPLPR